MEAALWCIRELRRADLAAVQALDIDAHGESWPSAALADQVTEPGHYGFVAVGGVEPDRPQHLGHAFARTEDRAYRITNVAVGAEHSGQGIASALIVALLAQVPVDCQLVRLQVRPDNRRAQRLYMRFGFAPAGVIRDFYSRALNHANRDAIEMTMNPTDPAVAARIAALGPYAEAEQ